MTGREAERWGSYVLEERLAAGGMAEVFRARRLGAAAFTRQVCVKRLHAHLTDDPEFVEMFLDEARTGARLRHRNIVAIDDLGEHEGRYFLAMEYVHGVDLAKLESRARSTGVPIEPAVAVFVANEVLSALHAAHTALDPETGTALHVVHRDVAPHNVLVSFGGEVKLGDFGIARAAGRRRETQGAVVRGRFGYMPLEQAGGRGVDARTDLFALGVVLYELLTGRRPFRGDDADATLETIIAAQVLDDRPPLGTLRDDLPDALRTLVERLLAPKADDRPPSAQAALATLSSLRESVTGGAALALLMTRLFPGQGSAAAVAAVPDAVSATADTRPDAARGDGALRLASETDPEAASPITGVASTLPRAPAVLRASRMGGMIALVAGVVLGGAVVGVTMARRASRPSPVAPDLVADRPRAAPVAPVVPSPVPRPLAPPPVSPPLEPLVAPAPSPVRVATTPSHGHAHHVAASVAPVSAPAALPPAPAPSPAAGALRVVVGSQAGTIYVDGRELGHVRVDTRVDGDSTHLVHVDCDHPVSRSVHVPAGHRIVLLEDDEGHVTVSDQPL